MWSFGKFLIRAAKGWLVLASVLSGLAAIWAISAGARLFGGFGETIAAQLGAIFGEWVFFGLLPAGILYAVARVLLYYATDSPTRYRFGHFGMPHYVKIDVMKKTKDSVDNAIIEFINKNTRGIWSHGKRLAATPDHEARIYYFRRKDDAEKLRVWIEQTDDQRVTSAVKMNRTA